MGQINRLPRARGPTAPLPGVVLVTAVGNLGTCDDGMAIRRRRLFAFPYPPQGAETMKVKLPGLSPAVNQIVVHFLAVFLVAFGVALGAGATGVVSVSSLLALITAAAAAGIVAVAHLALGLLPQQPVADGYLFALNAKVRSALHQIVLSTVVTFLTVFGTELVSGAVHVTSLPNIAALIIAAITAAIGAVVTYLTGLIPQPQPVAA